jgi:hypothetical protein
MTTEALQTTLAAEHAAVWVYGVLGGQVSRSADSRLAADIEESYRIHRGRRDTLVQAITDDGAEPVGAELGYQLPNGAGSSSEIVAAALVTEQRCAATYADLVAHTEDDRRRWAVTALTDAAVRQLRFRGSPETFPGAEELADR